MAAAPDAKRPKLSDVELASLLSDASERLRWAPHLQKPFEEMFAFLERRPSSCDVDEVVDKLVDHYILQWVSRRGSIANHADKLGVPASVVQP